jgi:archaetidylinositol phosphate synthase
MQENSGGDKAKPRINYHPLGPFERRALPWMAKRLPSWIVPDHLTFIGQFAALVIGAAYVLTYYGYGWLWLANAGLVLHWWADSLDGTLARTRHIERERYGFFMDHFSDALSIFLICIGMGLSPIMDLQIALLLIIAYYAMMMLSYLVLLSRDVFKISFGGVGPTEIRMVIILANIVVWYTGNPKVNFFGYTFTLFSAMGLITALTLLVVYMIFGEIERRKLAVLDPPKKK